jgi:hypothetical protein
MVIDRLDTGSATLSRIIEEAQRVEAAKQACCTLVSRLREQESASRRSIRTRRVER